MPSMPTPSMPSLPTPSLPSMPSSAVVPRGTGRPGQGGRRHRPGPRPAAAAAALRARDVAVFALVSRLAQGGAHAAGRGHARRRGAAAGRSLGGANSQGRRRRATGSGAGGGRRRRAGGSPCRSRCRRRPTCRPSPGRAPSGAGSVGTTPRRRSATTARRWRCPRCRNCRRCRRPRCRLCPRSPWHRTPRPRRRTPRACRCHRFRPPSLPSLPGVPGLPSLPALPQVEINPIANIAVERPSVPDDAAPIEYDDLVKKARLGACPRSSSCRRTATWPSRRSPTAPCARLRWKTTSRAATSSPRRCATTACPTRAVQPGQVQRGREADVDAPKNQNVLDAEARQRDEDARLAALDARGSRPRSAPPPRRHGRAGRVN